MLGTEFLRINQNTVLSFDCFNLRFFTLNGDRFQLLQTVPLNTLGSQVLTEYLSLNMHKHTQTSIRIIMQAQDKGAVIAEVDFEKDLREDIAMVNFDDTLYEVSQNDQLVGFATQGMGVRVYQKSGTYE